MSGGGGGCPMWVLTYADMITVLMGFFVIMSTLNRPGPKQDAVILSLVEQFGSAEALAKFTKTAKQRGLKDDKLGQAKKPSNKLPKPIKGLPGANDKVRTIRDGNRITVGGAVLFEPGQAELRPEAEAEILKIAETLRGKRHLIEVKAYANPAGLTGPSTFKDIHELADARTRHIVALIVAKGNIRRELLRRAVAAPVEVVTLVAEEQGENLVERVDITMYESSTRDYEPGS